MSVAKFLHSLAPKLRNNARIGLSIFVYRRSYIYSLSILDPSNIQIVEAVWFSDKIERYVFIRQVLLNPVEQYKNRYGLDKYLSSLAKLESQLFTGLGPVNPVNNTNWLEIGQRSFFPSIIFAIFELLLPIFLER